MNNKIIFQYFVYKLQTALDRNCQYKIYSSQYVARLRRLIKVLKSTEEKEYAKPQQITLFIYVDCELQFRPQFLSRKMQPQWQGRQLSGMSHSNEGPGNL